MDKITVKRLIKLLENTEVKTEEDYNKLINEVKDWSARSKAEAKATRSEKKETSKKALKLGEEDINSVCDSAEKIVQGELDKVNSELNSLTEPANKIMFVSNKINEAQYLHGQLSGINMIRESLLHDYALKSTKY